MTIEKNETTLCLMHSSNIELDNKAKINFELFLIHFFSLLKHFLEKSEYIDYSGFCQSKKIHMNISENQSIFTVGGVKISLDKAGNQYQISGPRENIYYLCHVLNHAENLQYETNETLLQLISTCAKVDGSNEVSLQHRLKFNLAPHYSLHPSVDFTRALDPAAQHLIAVQSQSYDLDAKACLKFFNESFDSQKKLSGEVDAILGHYMQLLRKENAELEIRKRNLHQTGVPKWMFWTDKNKAVLAVEQEQKLKGKKIGTLEKALSGDTIKIKDVLKELNQSPDFFSQYHFSIFNCLGKYNYFTRSARYYRNLENLDKKASEMQWRLFDSAYKAMWDRRFESLELQWLDEVSKKLDSIHRQNSEMLSAGFQVTSGCVDLKLLGNKMHVLEKQQKSFLMIERRVIHAEVQENKKNLYQEFKREMTSGENKNLLENYLGKIDRLERAGRSLGNG